MSAVQKLANNEAAMMQEVQRVQDLMSKTATGKKMMEASVAMASTPEMNQLMALLGNPEVREEERMLLAQYMGEMLKQDPMHGMVMFADYLYEVAENPLYAEGKEYYMEMADTAMDVHETDAYQTYIKAYQIFEEDQTPEAKLARNATEEMQRKMRQWAEIKEDQ